MGVNSLSCLSWDVHVLLPLDISASGSQAFGLRLRLTALAPQALGFVLGTLVSLHYRLQKADHGPSQPPKSHEPIPIINLSLSVSLSPSHMCVYTHTHTLAHNYIVHWFCFFGEL